MVVFRFLEFFSAGVLVLQLVTRRDTIVFLDYFGSWELCLPFVQPEVSVSGYIDFNGLSVCCLCVAVFLGYLLFTKSKVCCDLVCEPYFQ
jgi:hypothetical protein